MRYSPAIDFFEVGDISPLILSNKKSLYYLDMCRRVKANNDDFTIFVIVELTLFFFSSRKYAVDSALDCHRNGFACFTS